MHFNPPNTKEGSGEYSTTFWYILLVEFSAAQISHPTGLPYHKHLYSFTPNFLTFPLTEVQQA